MILEPDVEALLKFVGYRKRKIFNRYKPAHLVIDDYLTSGVHNYDNLDENSEDEIKGTITFLSPKEYTGSIWVGRVIEIYEGKSLVGYAKITKIFNPIPRIS